MTSFLLDTCTFLWLISDADYLSTKALDYCKDPNNTLYLSAVSTWEIAAKHALGRLPLPDEPMSFIQQMREKHFVDALPLVEADVVHLVKLPALHKDPFDRMLICQAIENGLTLLTPDSAITRYAVKTAW